MPNASNELARRSRRCVVQICHNARAAHIGSALSVIDILAVLYSGTANCAPERIADPDRDVVILSKGHAAAALYAVLGNAGYFPLDWLDDYCGDGAPLSGHVTKGRVPGVEFSTGSLGHGLPVGCGIALARLKRGLPGRVFVILSDGECDEGSNWEAALFAAHNRLANLTVVIDRNGLQSLTGTERTLRLEPLPDKWEAFGWKVSEVDGHDHSALRQALQATDKHRPSAIVARTTKGKGVSFMENSVLWHYRSPDLDALAAALSELDGASRA